MSTLPHGPVPATDPRERKREQRGWYFYDWANSTFFTSVITVFGALYMSSVAAADARDDFARNGPTPCVNPDGTDNYLRDCDISLLGLEFPAGSLWGYLLAVATVIQVLVLPITGAIADRSQYKKRILGFFAFLGAGASALLFFMTDGLWQLGVALYILGNIGYGASIVTYYSFLPDIATPDERDAVSAKGWAFGYLGGGIALALQLAFYLNRDAFGVSESAAVRICFLTSGLWWAAFTLIPLRRLREHQRPHGSEQGASVLRAGFTELRQTISAARAFPLTLAFLGAYLIYTDGISTVVTVSAQYGKEELRFSNEVLITTILVIQFVAYLGGMAHGLVAKRIGAKKTILGSLVIWMVVVASAFFIQAGQQLQFYAVAAGIGLVLGGTNALSRSLYSQLIPAGKEAQYYSLYEIGERGTSWLGPLLFAAVGQATGSFRYAIIALLVFFVVGFVLVALVPVRRAIAAAGNREPAVL
ncbi:major facilitator superfamily permease [Saccharomonospora marina XMU15]|uniref:Major facilitator superfamily permease n=1 Tax=Saccharomonospora marina XMU15 TaxID=882083 RepID=H5X4M6_9PSEU|nr:MFS transporter [Saccharomonospora marina]EHR51102.1 major facilitator superfamily permease [Saccharomonospora marina XMU15]